MEKKDFGYLGEQQRFDFDRAFEIRRREAIKKNLKRLKEKEKAKERQESLRDLRLARIFLLFLVFSLGCTIHQRYIYDPYAHTVLDTKERDLYVCDDFDRQFKSDHVRILSCLNN